MIHCFRALLIVALVVLPRTGRSSTSNQAQASFNSTASEFESANKLYEQGKFKEAAVLYERLLGRGLESPTVYFNLGNAWYKAGQNGRAVAAYLNAERLAPRDPNIRYNLGFVRTKVNVGPVSAGTALQRTLRHLSVNEWTIAAAAGLWVLLFLMAGREFRPGWRLPLRSYTLTAAVAAALLTVAAGAAFYDRRHASAAVVIVPDAVVRYGPLDESKTFYDLRDGAEVRLLQEQSQGPWAKIEDATGRQGWLRRDQILVAAPSLKKQPADNSKSEMKSQT